MATEHRFYIEEVEDGDAAWPELEPMIAALIEFHQPWDQKELRADWAGRMRGFMAPGADSLTLVARADSGEAIGFVQGTVSRDYGIFIETFGYINNIFVREEARSSGVGSALLGGFEAWARDNGADEVRLNVNANNDIGFAFWTRSGFEVETHSMRKTLEAA